MSAARMTRRTLLAATAGAAAMELTRPAGALAALAAPPAIELRARRVGSLTSAIRTIELTRSADLLGLDWAAGSSGATRASHAGAGPRVQLRFRRSDGRWSPWQSAAAAGHGPDRPAAGETIVGEPVWSGGTDAVQISSDRQLSDVHLHEVDVSGGVGARRLALAAGPLAFTAALPQALPVLQAGAGQPPIIARRAWARGMAHPRVTPGYGSVEMAFVHHTENPNGYLAGEVPAMLRAIFAFHRFIRGWDDIGYNFVIDAFGRTFEARAGGIDEPVVGAQAGGYNLVSTGVAVLGSFASSPISAAAKQALQGLLSWKLALHGAPTVGRVKVRVNPQGAPYSRFPANALVSLPRIAGHRDADSTDCPGDALYGELAGIRADVLRASPRPLRVTLALGEHDLPQPASSGRTVSPSTLTGTLAFSDGTPIAGASIAVQSRAVSRRGEVVSEATIGQALTDAAGGFSLVLGLAPLARGGISLRALYAGPAGDASLPTGATVSDPLALADALNPLPAAATIPSAAGAPAP